MSKFQDETTRGEQWPIEKIIPYDKNAKKHPKEQIEAIARSIDEMGWRHRIIVDENGVIIAGHGRHQAAIFRHQLTAPVTVVKDLSEAKIKQLRLIDNQVVSNDYDTRLLTEELRDLIDNHDMDMSWAYDERDLDFGLNDNGLISDEALTEDISDDMEDYTQNTLDSIKKQDKDEVPISKIFSFNKATGEQARMLTLLEKYAEGETELQGAEALAAFTEKLLSA